MNFRKVLKRDPLVFKLCRSKNVSFVGVVWATSNGLVTRPKRSGTLHPPSLCRGYEAVRGRSDPHGIRLAPNKKRSDLKTERPQHFNTLLMHTQGASRGALRTGSWGATWVPGNAQRPACTRVCPGLWVYPVFGSLGIPAYLGVPGYTAVASVWGLVRDLDGLPTRPPIGGSGGREPLRVRRGLGGGDHALDRGRPPGHGLGIQAKNRQEHLGPSASKHDSTDRSEASSWTAPGCARVLSTLGPRHTRALWDRGFIRDPHMPGDLGRST